MVIQPHDICDQCASWSESNQKLTRWIIRSVRWPAMEPIYACGQHLQRAIHYFTDSGDEVIVSVHKQPKREAT